jgi:hypothetical protein
VVASARLQRAISKQFFFEKKNQKTFTRLSPTAARQPRKSFCFFFQKEALAFFLPPPR